MPTKKASVAPNAQRRPIRTTAVRLNLDGYPADIHAVMRVNPPMREYEGLSSDTRGTLRKLIVDWNLTDDDGTPVALDDTLSGATDEELAALLEGWYAALKERSGAVAVQSTPGDAKHALEEKS